jgi:hypothetical protein
MRCEYKEKKVNLNILSDEIVSFFARRGFKAFAEKGASRIFISVKSEGFNRTVANVTLESSVDDSVIVDFEGIRNSAFVKMAPLLALLGGGVFILKSLNASEILDRLERDFWEIVDRFMSSY